MANLVHEQGAWTTLVDITTTMLENAQTEATQYKSGYWETPRPWPLAPTALRGLQWPVVRNQQGL